MNKKLAAVTVGLVVLIGGSLVAYGVTRGDDATGSDSATSSTESTATESTAPDQVTREEADLPTVASEAEGAYVDYSPTAIADATGDTVLFFHAPWCPSCRSLETDILSSGVPAGVTVIKVDYDTNQDLRQKYGVTVQTTFVKVDPAGEGLGNFVPAEDLRLAAVVDALL
ncbi:thiol-disulfide isomerase/thioredoxin [Salinibacterium sp. CAN_S4]|uniref:thioredoxin family protein n=1 Tax=Salinibacterium sp. CAN_S4 TaxID=2787727 RepID=UPI0018EFB0FE